jgi:hypothetical protein
MALGGEDLQVRDALFQPKLGKFAGFGKDGFVLPARGLDFLAEWKGKLHGGQLPSAQMMPHIDPKKNVENQIPGTTVTVMALEVLRGHP